MNREQTSQTVFSQEELEQKLSRALREDAQDGRDVRFRNSLYSERAANFLMELLDIYKISKEECIVIDIGCGGISNRMLYEDDKEKVHYRPFMPYYLRSLGLPHRNIYGIDIGKPDDLLGDVYNHIQTDIIYSLKSPKVLLQLIPEIRNVKSLIFTSNNLLGVISPSFMRIGGNSGEVLNGVIAASNYFKNLGVDSVIFTQDIYNEYGLYGVSSNINSDAIEGSIELTNRWIDFKNGLI